MTVDLLPAHMNFSTKQITNLPTTLQPDKLTRERDTKQTTPNPCAIGSICSKCHYHSIILGGNQLQYPGRTKKSTVTASSTLQQHAPATRAV